jgi:hypothetical protein
MFGKFKILRLEMQACIFCLEDLTDITPLNFSKERICPCKIYAHVDCWMKYQLHKGYFECPICHFTIVSVITSVPVNIPTEHIISINLPQAQGINCNNRGLLVIIILFIIFMTTFSVVYMTKA